MIAGDPIHVAVSGIPNGIGVGVYLENAALTFPFHEVSIASPSPSSLDCIFPLTMESPIIQGTYNPLPAGNYAVVAYQVGNPNPPLATLDITVLAYVTPPFPSINLESWNLAIMAVGGSPGNILASSDKSFAIKGTVIFTPGRWENTSGNRHPLNVTGQITLYGDFSGTLTPEKRLIGSPAFDAGGFPSVSFDTTTIPDGTYMLGMDIVDCSDPMDGNGLQWSAYQLLQYPVSVVVINTSPKSPSGTYLIPTASLKSNAEVNSTAVDFVTYSGVPQPNRSYPYPGPSLTPVFAPPVTDPASPFHANPADARTGGTVSYYMENSDMLNLHEYDVLPMFQTTKVGGVFAGSWSGEGGDESIEGTYPVMAGESWLDGGRNSHMGTGNSIIVATPSTGPFSAYHWTIIQLDGRLAVRDLAGNMLTIAGYRRDTTKLPIDYLDGTIGEFPNTVQVGTIDPSPAVTFSDFGGGPNDCCWDPRNPNICYVSQTIDHCIIVCDFTATGPYGPSNPRCYRYAGYKGGVNGNGVGGYVDGPALGTVIGAVQQHDGAQFNGIYSICMQKVSGIAGHPAGTMYVADNYNCLIRKILPTGTPGVAGAVSTLCGLAGGTAAPGLTPGFQTAVLATSTITVTSITSNGDGSASVVLASAPTFPLGVGWKMVIRSGGSNYVSGGSTFENSSYGIYTVSALGVDSQHFSLTMNPVPPAGAIIAVIPVADHYSSPTQIAFSASNCFTTFPQTVRMTSTGDIVYGEAWYNYMMRRIWLSGPNANTITRIAPFGNLAQISGPGFGFHDVDDVGACGPIDDIVCIKTDSNPGSAGYTSRFSIDGSVQVPFIGGDGGRLFPQENTGGTGHYPWAFAFSKTQCRFIAAGKADTIFYSGRPNRPGIDPPFDAYDATLGIVGRLNFLQGTCQVFPWQMRPSFAALYGGAGIGLLGQNVVPTVDDLLGLYPNDYSPFLGSLAQFIQQGMGGKTARPEFSMDDTVMPAVPGRDLAQLVYFLRREALSGSYPTVTPPILMGEDGAGSGALVSPNSYALNCIRPAISAVTPTRLSSPSNNINVTWTTDTPTLGIIAAGSLNSAGGGYPYNMWTLPEQDNAGVYGTSHNVTITGLPPTLPTHVCLLVKDKAGNWARSPDVVVT
jgi:hypothetical protein